MSITSAFSSITVYLLSVLVWNLRVDTWNGVGSIISILAILMYLFDAGGCVDLKIDTDAENFDIDIQKKQKSKLSVYFVIILGSPNFKECPSIVRRYIFRCSYLLFFEWETIGHRNLIRQSS